MSCCTTLSGFQKDCGANKGGIVRAWVACFDEAAQPTLDETTRTITSLGAGAANAYHEYGFEKNTGNFITTKVKNAVNGTLYHSTVITYQFQKLETVKMIEFENLGESDTRQIVEDRNGKYWFFGYDEPVVMQDGSTAETGTDIDDFNGYNLTFLDISDRPPFEITAEAMEAILNPTTP